MLDPDKVEKALAEVREGNSEAFSVVVRETASVMRAVVNFYLSTDEKADDVLQEAYLSIFRQINRYQPGTNCVAWMKSVARFSALTARNASQRQKDHLNSYCQEVEDKLCDALVEQDEECPAEDRMRRMMNCLSSLTERTREIVALHYFKSLPFEAVAARVSMTANAVGVALHRARQALARCVQAGGSVS